MRRTFSTASKQPQTPFIKNFDRLTSHYKERRSFQYLAEDLRARPYFNHLSTLTRIKIFLVSKRKRFLYAFLFFISFNLIGNIFGFIIARAERSIRKYKKQWIFNKNSSLLTYPSAVDTLYEPQTISSPSTEKISESFLKYDRLLKDGMSRLFIIRVLETVSALNYSIFLIAG